jgi:hypothetical protein
MPRQKQQNAEATLLSGYSSRQRWTMLTTHTHLSLLLSSDPIRNYSLKYVLHIATANTNCLNPTERRNDIFNFLFFCCVLWESPACAMLRTTKSRNMENTSRDSFTQLCKHNQCQWDDYNENQANLTFFNYYTKFHENPPNDLVA